MKITITQPMSSEELCTSLQHFLDLHYGKNTQFENVKLYMTAPDGANDFDSWKLSSDGFSNVSDDYQERFLELLSKRIIEDCYNIGMKVSDLEQQLQKNQDFLAKRSSAKIPNQRLINYSKTRIANISEELTLLKEQADIMAFLSDGYTLNPYSINLHRHISRDKIIKLEALCTFTDDTNTNRYCHAVYQVATDTLALDYLIIKPRGF